MSCCPPRHDPLLIVVEALLFRREPPDLGLARALGEPQRDLTLVVHQPEVREEPEVASGALTNRSQCGECVRPIAPGLVRRLVDRGVRHREVGDLRTTDSVTELAEEDSVRCGRGPNWARLRET